MPHRHAHETLTYLDRLYGKAKDSWWVFRHGIDPQGSPLPWGRVVYYASSEQEARRWMDAATALPGAR